MYVYTYTHTHAYIYIYICIYICTYTYTLRMPGSPSRFAHVSHGSSWRRSNLQGWLTQFLWNMLFRTPAVLAGRFAVLVSYEALLLPRLLHLQLLFGSCVDPFIRFRFLVFAIGPVLFMFGFGSCGSWSILVLFASVFGTFCIDICFFFSGVGKANTDCFPQEVYCFPQVVSWAAAFKERRELNSENQSFLKLSVHAIYYEETHICFFPWTQKAITTFPISLLGEGKTVPVPLVRFCTRFQRFTVPVVHRLFDFLRFGSTVPVRFQNLTAHCILPSHGWFHSS